MIRAADGMILGLAFTRDGARMAQLARALVFFGPDISITEFPAWDCQPYDRASPLPGIVAQRMTALARLARLKGRESASVVLTTVNAIVQRVTRLTSESAGARGGDSTRGRVWRVLSSSAVNRFGKPTAFTLYPEPQPALLADPSSPIAARAGFATRALWVTRYDPAQRYPAGDFVNQSPGGGLPDYIAADRDIDGQDIVVWHTFGPTHFVRL